VGFCISGSKIHQKVNPNRPNEENDWECSLCGDSPCNFAESLFFQTFGLPVLHRLPLAFRASEVSLRSEVFVLASGFFGLEAARKLKQTDPKEFSFLVRTEL
jgi:hypothetical protein